MVPQNTGPQTGTQSAKFTDPDFPPEQLSLIGNARGSDPTEQQRIAKDVTWKRLPEVYPQGLKVFDANIKPSDIHQNELGDCYFLAAASATAEDPDRIKRLFKTKQITPEGKYHLNLFLEGIWREVVIDDHIPCKSNGYQAVPKFSGTKSNEAWSLLLEKAYAKAYGGYYNIEGGRAHEALSELTGAPIKLFSMTSNFPYDKERIWRSILYSEYKNFIMTAESSDFK